MPGYRKTQNVDLDKMRGLKKAEEGASKKKKGASSYRNTKEGKIARIVSGLKKMRGGAG